VARVFTGNFTQQEPIPEAAIARAVEVMRSGRLHRYNTGQGEVSEAVLLEREFAAMVGARYCLACASGGYGLATALKAAGLTPGEPVLTNGFTLSPVPGAIAAAGGRPVLVEISDELVIDLDDLERKIASSGARTLMLSHMRGHLCDMDRLTEIAAAHGLRMIEDCAHTMGAAWRGTPSGRHGLAACYSTQTYKHVNSGEGGLIVSDDAELMARATILSGSYMFYDRHAAGPAPEVFADIRLDTPNCSGRMDDLRAAILRPQLAALAANRERWNARYRAVEEELSNLPGVRLPRRPAEETFVGSSIQFQLADFDAAAIMDVLKRCKAHGVDLKWFGASEPVAYTSRHQSWRYVAPQELPATDRILEHLLDMRLPLTFSVEDCRLIGTIIRECISETCAAVAAGELAAAADFVPEAS
jgi:dTDP-4-amino-4,6-dideoxygalactose transaminase